MNGMGGLNEQGRGVGTERTSDSSSMAIPLGGSFRRDRSVWAIDRYMRLKLREGSLEEGRETKMAEERNESEGWKKRQKEEKNR